MPMLYMDSNNCFQLHSDDSSYERHTVVTFGPKAAIRGGDRKGLKVFSFIRGDDKLSLLLGNCDVLSMTQAVNGAIPQ